MKVLAILTLLAVFITGGTLGSVLGFGEAILDAGGTMLESVNDILGIPDAQRYDILSIPPYERITNPVLNPDDTMSLADFLYMRHKDAVRDNTSIGGTSLADFYGENNYNVVDRYLYFIKGTAVGTLDTDLQGYSEGEKVLFTYKIPCIRYLYEGDIFFMLDPLATSWLPGFDEASPFQAFSNREAVTYYGVNQVRENGYLSYYSITGSPSSDFDVHISGEYYNVIVEQTQYEVVDYLNDEVVIDRMNVKILAVYTENLKDGAFNNIDRR